MPVSPQGLGTLHATPSFPRLWEFLEERTEQGTRTDLRRVMASHRGQVTSHSDGKSLWASHRASGHMGKVIFLMLKSNENSFIHSLRGAQKRREVVYVSGLHKKVNFYRKRLFLNTS